MPSDRSAARDLAVTSARPHHHIPRPDAMTCRSSGGAADLAIVESPSNEEILKPPPLTMLKSPNLQTPPQRRVGNTSYAMTPTLKGTDALANAFAMFGTALLSCSFLVLGATAFIPPPQAASTYGLDETSAGWMQACGMRDVVLGIATMALHATHRAALRVFLPVVLLVPLGDAWVVSRHGADGDGLSGYERLFAPCVFPTCHSTSTSNSTDAYAFILHAY